jgi:hypothetical protein
LRANATGITSGLEDADPSMARQQKHSDGEPSTTLRVKRLGPWQREQMPGPVAGTGDPSRDTKCPGSGGGAQPVGASRWSRKVPVARDTISASASRTVASA